MDKKKVYVTRIIPNEAIKLLKKHFDVEINPQDRVLLRGELLEKVKGKDAVLCLLTDNIDKEVFETAGEKCKIFANYAAGYSNIDTAAATQSGVIITNTPQVLDDATADLAWTLLMVVSRRIIAADKFTRNGAFQSCDPMMFLGREITGKTLGIVGAGRIGFNFAKKAKAFDMKILYTDLLRNYEMEKELGAIYVDKEALLKEADFVSLHVPLSPSTRHYISEKEFSVMKNTSVIVNTCSGPVIDEKALVKALKQGEIWGAGLDVFEHEPDIEPELLDMYNVAIVPHIASATMETRTKMGLTAANNIIKVLNGEKPDTCVNVEVLK
ncbi:D-glycerate dehydrogenase [Clostridium sp. CM028]|uniref:2-hydroxyacid dehydrogenase n=1 Tax=unclassified Clostridium TaxID=2614128 RepID=UPI001C0DF2E2|nr:MULTISPECIES: D-glycerate dehydrogenase [unclassified Clostridium]MBU3093152.1 D-glycerate dehydrogenase [Clostridium sp. CF011]MBW9147084.1 D-glycerate dehydrogenase [Clostridium sp. CM027]MBW9150124.1 D-glycerate dehydrogenase [Clostridium sp. CM028]UVE39568.1 D-glycerate dehydrogenase [Clostridium sp. CM027]WAG68473.1 D-glycerate dehydrogenase [Clostridium sp. CF011]